MSQTWPISAINEAEIAFARAQGLPPEILMPLHKAREVVQRPAENMNFQIGQDIVTPVLTGFAGWMARQAAHTGSSLFIGVMREGRLLAQLMQKLHGIDAREIWINRDLSMRAAFGCGDDEALVNWMVRTRLKAIGGGQAMQILLGRMIEHTICDMLPDATAAYKLIEKVKAYGWLDEARQRAGQLADRLLRHWQSVVGDVADRTTIYLMDFASVGNIQRSLETILAARGIKVKIVGLNFAMTAGSRFAEEKGCAMRGFLSERGEPAWIAQACARTPELMEIFAAATEGGLIDYGEDGTPKIASNPMNAYEAELNDDVQKCILDMAPDYQRTVGDALTPDIARCVWGRLLLQPLMEEARGIRYASLDAGLDGTLARNLVAELTGDPATWTKMQTAWPAASRLISGL